MNIRKVEHGSTRDWSSWWVGDFLDEATESQSSFLESPWRNWRWLSSRWCFPGKIHGLNPHLPWEVVRKPWQPWVKSSPRRSSGFGDALCQSNMAMGNPLKMEVSSWNFPASHGADYWRVNLNNVIFIWRFPQMRVPPKSSMLDGDFPWNKPSSELGVSPFMETPGQDMRKQLFEDGKGLRSECFHPFQVSWRSG